MKQKISETDRKAAFVVKMLSQGNPREKIRRDLAALYNKPMFTLGYVSKLYKHALDKACIKERIEVVTDNIPAELMGIATKGRDDRKLLLEKFDYLDDIRIVDFKVKKKDGDNFHLVFDALTEMLVPIKALGVSRGATIRCLVKAISSLDSEERQKMPFKKRLDIFPTAAEFYETDVPECSSSNLAREFSYLFQSEGQARKVPDLTNLMSFIPIRKSDLNSIRKLNENYSKIFGTEESTTEPLIDRMDMFLTSVSDEDVPIGGSKRLEGMIEKLNEVEVEERIELNISKYIGDIGCSLILRDQDKDLVDQRQGLRNYNAHTNCISYNQIATLAKRARTKRINGVVVIADGKKKANVIRKLLINGAINKLICDPAIADQLLKSD